MATIYGNFLSGTTSDAPLSAVATTVNSPGLAAMTTVTAPDTMWLTLDPEGVNGAPEICQVTVHVASATAVTVVRAQQSSAARIHPAGTTWCVSATKSDLDRFAAQRATADIADGAVTSAKIADGTIGTGDLADGAVTSAKIADGTIVTADLANGAVTSDKILDGSIVGGDIATGVITSSHIVDGTIATNDLADGAVTAAKLASAIPRGVMGYAQLTTDITGYNNTATDITGLTITWTAEAGRRYRITGHLGCVGQNTTGAFWNLQINDGGGAIMALSPHSLATGEQAPMTAFEIVSPSAGSITRKLRARTNAGTGDILASSGRTAFILVEDIGAA